MDKKRIILISFLCCLCLCPFNLFAWGGGHPFQGEILFSVLPEEIRTFFLQSAGEDKKNPIAKYAGYPDSTESFDSGLIGDEAIAFLEKHRVKNRFYLHSTSIDGRGTAACFTLLVKSFKENNSKHAAVWAGSLVHVIGDEFACNHTPLIHYILRAFVPQKIKMGRGVGTDFANVNNPAGRKIIDSILEEYKPKFISDNPDEVFTLLLSGFRNCPFMTERESRIAATYTETACDDVMDAGRRALVELGTEGIKQVGDYIVTAWRYAQEGKIPVITDGIIEVSLRNGAEYEQTKPLAKDSIYAGLLNLPVEKGSVGIVVEPTRNKPSLGGGSKYIYASIMHTMKNAGIPYRPVDIRHIETEGLPPPEEMPVLIVGGSAGFPIPEAKVRSYAEAGGRVMLIGGRDKNMLGELSRDIKSVPADMIPVSRGVGDRIYKFSVRFLEEYGEFLGDKEYRFVKNANTPAGWQQPVCTLHVVSDNPRARSLVRISDGDKTVVVAAALMGEKNRARYIFIPEYLLAPFLLSGEDTLADPARAYLDKVGRALLASSLKLLCPDIKNLEQLVTSTKERLADVD